MSILVAAFVILFLIVNTALLTVLLIKASVPPNNTFKDEFARISNNLERTERIVREDILGNRKELAETLNAFEQAIGKQLKDLTEMNETKLEKIRGEVEQKLESLQRDNNEKLEKMRETVDEKLHSTLEKRLGESFKLVSERLEKVHQGLGEMQNLALGVGDLKKLLTNVKSRGIWGEVLLENLLEEVLTPDQFLKNVPTKQKSNDPVEFAIKMPGRNGEMVLLPIDAKFPREDYEKLVEAQDAGDKEMIEETGRALESRIKFESKKIRDKYIEPPFTTEYAILFLPTESLFAEVLRRPGLFDFIRSQYRVTVAGPTTILAILNALQMGFRTLAVEKRASEVWNLLGSVKTEFGRFGDILEKTHKKLQEASNTIEDASKKSRTIERRLQDVQELPQQDVSPELLEHES